LAIVLIFLVLSAQFESFKDPIIVMMTVPLALTGALLFMWYFGITMNIFSQIGIIMLIGLVSKNGILIVEFANQRKNVGDEQGGSDQVFCFSPFQAYPDDQPVNYSRCYAPCARMG
jgi:multidrug efflux pump subunit AcrB